MDLAFLKQPKKGLGIYAPTQLAAWKREYDFVDYYELVVGTLFDYRLADLNFKYDAEKLIHIFVYNMKNQVVALPKTCQLRKAMSREKETGGVILSDKCDRMVCIKTLEYLESIGLISFSEDRTILSVTPIKKLSPENRLRVLKVENKHTLDVNNLKLMIFNCTEDILSPKRNCFIEPKRKKDPVDRLLKGRDFETFYLGVQEKIDKYLKPRQKKATTKEPIWKKFENMPFEETPLLPLDEPQILSDTNDENNN